MMAYVWEYKLEGLGGVPLDTFCLKLILGVDPPGKHVLLLIQLLLLL